MKSEISLSFVSVICKDMIGQSSFYRDLFDLTEASELASDCFRALRLGGTILGFHSDAAVALLDLSEETQLGNVSSAFWTFEVASSDSVGRLTEQAVTLGAVLIKAPYDTYYGARQSVLRDPEGNVFRINRSGGAAGPEFSS